MLVALWADVMPAKEQVTGGGMVKLQGTGPLTLRKNFVWTFVGNSVYAVCQGGIVVVLAKLGTPEMLGQFALGLAVCAPVITFTNLALRPVQATDARQEKQFGHYLALRLVTVPLALMMIAVIVLAVGYARNTALVILVVGVAKALESVSDVFYGLLQQHERMDRIAKSMIGKGLLSLVALTIGVYLSGRLVWGVASLAAAWALVLLLYDMRSSALLLTAAPRGDTSMSSTHLRPLWERSALIGLAKLSLPLGFATMLVSLNANVPRYFIAHILGERELGIFAAMAYFQMPGLAVVNALAQAASPRLAKYYSHGNSVAFRKLLLKLVGIGVLLGGVVVLMALAAGRELLTLLYRPEYAEHTNVFVWLMVAAAIGHAGSFLGYGVTASRYFKIQPFILLISVVFTTTLCLQLIPLHGLLGVGWLVVFVACVQSIALILVIFHALQALNKKMSIGTARFGNG